MVIIFLLLCIIWLLITYPRPYGPRFNKLSLLRVYRKNFYQKNILSYRMTTYKDFFANFFWLTVYLGIFIVGFFLLKLTNTEQQINLSKIWSQNLEIFQKLTILDKFVSVIIIIQIFIILVIIIQKIKKLFSTPMNRIHFFLSKYDLYRAIYSKFTLDYSTIPITNNLTDIWENLCDLLILGKIPQYSNGKFVNLSEHEFKIFKSRIYTFPYIVGVTIISFIWKNLAFCLILSCIIHDVLYNNTILQNVFFMYPIAHLVQIYQNLSSFYFTRSFMLDGDMVEILYPTPGKNYTILGLSEIPGYVLSNFIHSDYFRKEYLNKKKKRMKQLRRRAKIRKFLKRIQKVVKRLSEKKT